jgi:hypothetical protein
VIFEEKESRLEIMATGEAPVIENQVAQCMKVLADYLEGVGLRDYRRKQLEDACKGFTRGTTDRALKILENRGILEKVRRGVYRYKGAQPKLPNTQHNNIVGNGQTGEPGETLLLCKECIEVYRQQGHLRGIMGEAGSGTCENCGEMAELRRVFLAIGKHGKQPLEGHSSTANTPSEPASRGFSDKRDATPSVSRSPRAGWPGGKAGQQVAQASQEAEDNLATGEQAERMVICRECLRSLRDRGVEAEPSGEWFIANCEYCGQKGFCREVVLRIKRSGGGG